MPRVLPFALVVLLAGVPGCVAPPAEACAAVDGEGHWVAIRPIWNGTAAPAADACVRATRDGVALSAPVDDLGIAVLHLARGTWEVVATAPKEGDPRCRVEGARTLEVTGQADVIVRLERDAPCT